MENCPDLTCDWEATAAVDGILADLSAEELAQIYAGIDVVADRALAIKIGAAWAAKDPVAALKAALAKTPGNNATVARVFGEWAQNQPAAALAWLDSPGCPPELSGSKDALYQSAIGDLIERDFPLATGTIAKMSPDGAAEVLKDWGKTYSGDPAMRDQLVDFAKATGRPQDYAALNTAMVKSWPQEDSLGMMNYLIGLKGYLESGAVSTETRPAIDAAAVGASIYREYDRPALEWWMDRYSGSAEVPTPLAAAFADWYRKAPEKVNQWLAEQPPSQQLDGLHASLIPSLADSNNMVKAVENVTAISDPTLQSLTADRLALLWSNRDPQAAAQWRASLPTR
jgi:hypothetical protein